MPEMRNNVAAGCERAGFNTEGEPCVIEGTVWQNNSEPWMGNEVHGALDGVRWKGDSAHRFGSKCAAFRNFFVWKVFGSS